MRSAEILVLIKFSLLNQVKDENQLDFHILVVIY